MREGEADKWINTHLQLYTLNVIFSFRNANGETPFHLAASHGHADLVKYLIGVNKSCIELRDYQVEPINH